MISFLAVEENATGKNPTSCCVVFKFTDSSRPPISKSNKSNFNFSSANNALCSLSWCQMSASAPVAP